MSETRGTSAGDAEPPKGVTEGKGPDAALAARAEAAAWITRLHGPNRSEDMEAGFRRWLAERPENSAEFEGLTEIWDLVASAAPVRNSPRMERWEHSQEARELQTLREQLRAPTSRPIRTRAALAASILLACGLGAYGIYTYFAAPTYATAIGEQRVLHLTDSTRVSLNSDTRLSVHFSDAERRVTLEDGEALFEVAKDARRPFIVIVGDRAITALGTTFVVRRDSEQLAVTLVEGKVTVAPTGSFDPPSVRSLSPGQRITFTSGGAPALDTPRLETVIAWRRGEVMLDDTPLADAVAEMNRYDHVTIVVDDPELAALNISGLYHTGDSEGFAQSVARMYQLKVVSEEGRLHLRK